MKWFERRDDSALFQLAFTQGEKIGALSAELAHLRTTLDDVKKSLPAGQGLPSIDAAVLAACTRLSRNDPSLYRLLETQAKELLTKGIPVERVIEQLELGHKGPRMEKTA